MLINKVHYSFIFQSDTGQSLRLPEEKKVMRRNNEQKEQDGFVV